MVDVPPKLSVALEPCVSVPVPINPVATVNVPLLVEVVPAPALRLPLMVKVPAVLEVGVPLRVNWAAIGLTLVIGLARLDCDVCCSGVVASPAASAAA